MIDFNINRGLSTVLFSEPGIINPRLVIEEGCWYLCTDTAELFLGVRTEDGLTLKRINENIGQGEATIDPEVLSALSAEIAAIKNSLGSYATEQYVIDAIANHEGLAKKEEVEEVKTKLETEVLPIVPTVQELAEKAATQEWVTAKDFATETFVHEMIAKAELDDKEADLEAYYTKDQVDALIPDTSNFITEIPAEYVTDAELSAKGYLTEHQDISSKADRDHKHSYNDLTNKPEIPSIVGLATEQFVKNEIAKIELPEVDTSKLVTNEVFIAALAKKANEIPFTTAKFITNPIGSFEVGDDVNGLTFAQILAKLLGLTDTSPDYTPSIKEDITINERPLYQADRTGAIVEIPYEVITFDEEAATRAPAEATSGFYEIKNADGDTLEYGYQHITEPQDMYYMVALPSSIILGESAKLATWDTMANAWVEVDASTTLTSDFAEISAALAEAGLTPPTVVDGYTLWADLRDVNAGAKYRIIIMEEV